MVWSDDEALVVVVPIAESDVDVEVTDAAALSEIPELVVVCSSTLSSLDALLAVVPEAEAEAEEVEDPA